MESYELLNKLLELLIMQNLSTHQLQVLEKQLAVILSDYTISRKSFELVSYSPDKISPDIMEYLITLKVSGLSPNTLANYKLELHLFEQFVQMPLTQVTSAHIMKYIYICKQVHKVSDITLEHKRIVINCFFEWMFREHKILENPASRIKPIKCCVKILEPLTNEEFEKIRLACKNVRDSCLVEVLYSSGMRVSELRQVDISSIDFNNKRTIINGKGNKERIVRFSDRAILLINKYIATRTDTNTALFVTLKKPYNRLSKAGIEFIIRQIAIKASIDRFRVTPHTFRRSHGLAIYSKTNDIYKASASLGHTNITTTTRYIKLSNDSMQQTFNHVMN